MDAVAFQEAERKELIVMKCYLYMYLYTNTCIYMSVYVNMYLQLYKIRNAFIEFSPRLLANLI